MKPIRAAAPVGKQPENGRALDLFKIQVVGLNAAQAQAQAQVQVQISAGNLSQTSIMPLVLLALTSLGFRSAVPPIFHHHESPRAFRALPPIYATTASLRMQANSRPPYVLSGGPRPQWRGRAMGWLHKTRAWYIISIAYVVIASMLSRSSTLPLMPRELLLRVLVACASSLNVLVSDGYHNPDTRGPDALTPGAELVWLRLDYLGISGVLTTLLWLWASNLNFPGVTAACSYASGVSTTLVGVRARVWVPAKVGHRAVKFLMAFQFVGLLGYLVSLPFSPVRTRAPRRLSLVPVSISTLLLSVHPTLQACRMSKLIFATYAPGLLLYVLKQPKSSVFGFHEYFHTSVIMGHVASIYFDLHDIASPCARFLLAST